MEIILEYGEEGFFMNDNELREEVVSREQIYKGIILDVQRWQVTLPDGSPAPREIVLHKGACAVVPVDSEGNTYMVRQYRAAVGRVMEEIPAGKLDHAGEDRLEAAQRELREETGFTAKKWTHLGDLATTPGFSSEIISLYLAEELTAGETDFDDDEFLTCRKMPFAEALSKAMNGEYQDSKTVVALARAAAVLGKVKLDV